MEGKRQKAKGKRQKYGISCHLDAGALTDIGNEKAPDLRVFFNSNRRRAAFKKFLPFAFCLLPFAFCLLPSRAAFCLPVGAQGSSATDANFSYRFENPRFYIPLIEIELNAAGEGVLKFKRGESDELIDLKFALLPETMSRIRQLYDNTKFLISDENYQDKKDHSNLGWVTLSMSAGERKRDARFNYTPNAEIQELAEIFRAIATQHMDIFDIDTAQQYQPLDVPKQIEILENDLRLERIAEPKKLLPKLREIANGDLAPLIARNQAKRVIESIEKGKYKTPLKK